VEATVVSPRAAVALLDANVPMLRRTALRVSLCPDDAEEALQRATLILLTKGPAHPPRRLAAWMHVVTRREALAVRRDRERMLGAEVGDTLVSRAPCPAERAEIRERARERARLLARLKPDERRALVLKGAGYSYREICERTGWTYTKVNRCLAEGRARLRALGAPDPGRA
jgi:RNA polymerase sigma factor (sigma-70 family)